jgi:crossover junction endodeoxyribonuclease RuvC
MGQQSFQKIILGIDPGSNCTGFALLQGQTPLEYGCIIPPKNTTLAKKYLEIFEAVSFIIQKHKPDEMAIESQFVHKNIQSAMKLGMAKGACLIAAAKHDIEVFEYAPKKIKLAATGVGGASKHQVAHMLQLMLGLKDPIKPHDAADALAIALCHQQSFHTKKMLGYV